jgi:hypothetical protein
MQLKVTYKGYNFLAIADGAGLDVWANEENATEEIMAIATELWHTIFDMRIKLFGEAVEEHDTTYGELQASLDELGLR